MSKFRVRARYPLMVLGALIVTACASPTPVTQVGLNRDTPGATYEYFKAVALANQWGAEWSVFSPNFKAAINREVGRVIDQGDYATARQTIATNSQSDMQLLLNSTLGGVRMVGPNEAVVTISSGGRTVSPRMVRLTRWELKIRGVDEPAGEFISNPGDAITVNPDGSVTVSVRTDPGAAAYLRTIPRDQIEGFAIKSEWYVDDFGGLTGAVGSGVDQGTPAPQPGAFPPAGTGSPDGPGPVMGSGSPDG
ncbi:MAG: hypothetical protein ACYTG6_05305 [Planctomycetota bacterium]|jgi:hypothetical protein